GTAFTHGFTVVANPGTPGDLRLALFGTTPLSGAGEVAWCTFRAVGSSGSSTNLHWSQADLNEGNILSTPHDGTVNVQSTDVVLAVPDNAGGSPSGPGS